MKDTLCCLHLRFSLRFIVVALIVVGVPLAWLSARLQSMRSREQAEGQLKSLGADFNFSFARASTTPAEKMKAIAPSRDPFGPGGGGDPFEIPEAPYDGTVLTHVAESLGFPPPVPVESIHFTPKPERVNGDIIAVPCRVKDSDLELLKHFPEVCRLIVHANVTDAGVKHICQLTQLKELELRGYRITDKSMDAVVQIRSLEKLDLSGTKITDDGLKILALSSNLTDLRVSDTAITDGGLAHVSTMTTLVSLRLADTAVSNAGLRHLKHMPKLIDLDLSHTAVTDEGIGDLLDASQLEQLGIEGTHAASTTIDHLRETFPEIWIY